MGIDFRCAAEHTCIQGLDVGEMKYEEKIGSVSKEGALQVVLANI
jgi:hypothetical protein